MERLLDCFNDRLMAPCPLFMISSPVLYFPDEFICFCYCWCCCSLRLWSTCLSYTILADNVISIWTLNSKLTRDYIIGQTRAVRLYGVIHLVVHLFRVQFLFPLNTASVFSWPRCSGRFFFKQLFDSRWHIHSQGRARGGGFTRVTRRFPSESPSWVCSKRSARNHVFACSKSGLLVHYFSKTTRQNHAV